MYDIRFDKQFIDFLNKIEKKEMQRIWNKLQECKTEPFRYLKHLENIRGYKLRVGEYRIILDVGNVIHVLNVLKIGQEKKYLRIKFFNLIIF